MEWLIAHDDELNSSEKTSSGSKSNAEVINKEPETHESKDTDKNDKPVEGDANKKKLTVEEAQRLITERQKQREEEERKKEIENEKRRRLDGQKMTEVRVDLKDQEMINLAQQIRREKLEKELHRKQLLEQIARDRENMKQKNQAASDKSSSTSSSTTQTKPKTPGNPSNECKIALRFADGTSLIHAFSPREQLSAVKLYVQMQKNLQSKMDFIAPPNKKLTEDQMDETLENLGLCPASRLEVKLHDVIDLD